MVVLSAAVTTKTGRIVIARQYRELSRIRIEGLLAAFPKLIGTDRQHTYVETENVRYVYQPVETLFVLLITTRNSNIVEDLETLRLLGKILPEYSPRYGVVDEESVMEAAFEIIYSFDEVLDWGGHRENVDLQQIATFTEMYSHEERLVKMIQESKMQEAKEERKRREEEIRRQRNDGNDRLGMLGNELGKMLQAGGMGSFAQDLGLTGNQNKAVSNAAYAAAGGISSESYAQGNAMGMGVAMGNASGMSSSGSGMMGMGVDMGLSMPTSSGYGRSNAPLPVARTSAKKGMSLGKTKKNDSLLDSLRAEGEVVDAPISGMTGARSNAAAAYVPPTQSVHLATVEKLNLTVSRDGGIQNMEVKGDLMLRITDSAKAAIRLQVSTGDAAAHGVQQFKTHPNVDRTLFSTQGVIGLKDSKRPFPSGSPLVILRWRLVTKDESKAPLLISCWPSDHGDESVVNIEYELGANKEMRDVVIAIPLGSSNQPTVLHCDGEFIYNGRSQSIEWKLSMIDENNPQGSLEFSTPNVDSNSFFPINVNFISKHTYAPIAVSQVVQTATGEPVEYGHDISLVPETFSIV